MFKMQEGIMRIVTEEYCDECYKNAVLINLTCADIEEKVQG